LAFEYAALSLEDLSGVLEAARVEGTLEVAGRSWRPYPSFAARHPLEIYVLDRVARTIYSYDPFDHTITPMEQVSDSEMKAIAGEILENSPESDGAPVILLITAVFRRTMWKVGLNGYGLILRDVG
jgi:SagB-type dehydrogenase family enzyme